MTMLEAQFAQRCEDDRNQDRLKLERLRIKAVKEQTAELRALRVALETLLEHLAAVVKA